MEARSILVGKIYRTPEGEMRRVTDMDKQQVTYTPVTGVGGPGMVLQAPHKHLPVDDFAREVESEAQPKPATTTS